MFYILVEITAVNCFILSSHSYVAKEDKFTSHLAFREALYSGLFEHAKYTASPTTYTAVRHQRIQMKRSACVVCKQVSAEERRGVKGRKRQVLQALSPHIASKRKDRHVARPLTGCSSCKVSLCAKKGCWDVYHSGMN